MAQVKIIPDFVPADYPLDMLPMAPQYITIHDTGNPAPGANARANGAYMRSPAGIAADANWHFTVDDKEIRQHLPLNRNGWHASDGYNGPGNRTSIAIEICENSDGDRAKAEQNAAQLCAWLIENVPTLRPFPECMRQHHDWARDGKNCPHILRDRPGGWAGFLTAVYDAIRPPWSAPKVLVKLPGGAELWGELRGSTTWVTLPGTDFAQPIRPVADAMGRKVRWTPVPPTVTVE